MFSFVHIIFRSFIFFPAFFVAFLGSTCDPENDPCVFSNPIDAILGLFSMSVGDFEDIIQTFPTSRYSVLVYVSELLLIRSTTTTSTATTASKY